MNLTSPFPTRRITLHRGAGNSESLLGRLFLSPDQRPFFCVTRPTRFLVGLRPSRLRRYFIHHLNDLFNRPGAVRPLPEQD